MTYADIASQVTRLPLQERLMLLEALTRSVRRDLRAESADVRSPGQSMLSLAGSISAEDAQIMRVAIEAGCEQVDQRDW